MRDACLDERQKARENPVRQIIASFTWFLIASIRFKLLNKVTRES